MHHTLMIIGLTMRPVDYSVFLGLRSSPVNDDGHTFAIRMVRYPFNIHFLRMGAFEWKRLNGKRWLGRRTHPPRHRQR